MCARYGLEAEFNLFSRNYKIGEFPKFKLSESTIFPHTLGPVIYENNGDRKIELMNFSLIPSWSKVRKPKFATYNARIETVLEKPAWKEAFKKRHCLIPISFFFESIYVGDYAGNTISIRNENAELMTAAGIWESWTDRETGESINSYAILTTKPSSQLLTAGHDRSPIFLKSNSFDTWLDEDINKDWIQFLNTNTDPIKFQFKVESKLKKYSQSVNIK